MVLSPSCSVEVTTTVVPGRRPRRRARRPTRTTWTSTPWSSSTRASAWAPSGPGFAGSKRSVVLLAAVGRPAPRRTTARTTSAPTISSVARCRPRARRGHRQHRQLVVEGEHVERLLAGGRPVAVQHGVEERGGARRPVPLRRGTRGARTPATSCAVAPGVSSRRPALDLAHGQRPEAVDERVLVPALGERRLGAGAQLGGGDRLVGEHRAAGRAGARALPRARGTSQQPARRPAGPRSTIAANV